MSIAWSDIKSSITTQVVQFSDLPVSAVRWVDEPSGPLMGSLPVVYLRVSAVIPVGIEENRLEDSVNPLDDQLVTVRGQRQFTLSIRCESMTPDITDDRHASNVIEKIKTRFRRFTAVDSRFGVFAICNYAGSTWFSYVSNGRPVNTYVADFTCATVNNDTDTSSNSGDWIGEAFVSGPVKNDHADVIDNVSLDITKP